MNTWMPTISCARGGIPVETLTIEALTIGRLEPPITLRRGQFLAVISPTEAAAFEVDCQVGERSQIVAEVSA